MNEHYSPRPLDPWPADRDHLPAVADHEAPTEWFPAAQFPTERIPTAHYPREQFAYLPATRPDEPLAHEGGLAYGNPPAAPYGAPEEFIPQHLAAWPFGTSPYSAGAYPPHVMAPPFMPYPHHMQQTVLVTNGGGRRVNHALHLLLTLLSFGLWLPVWVILAIAKS